MSDEMAKVLIPIERPAPDVAQLVKDLQASGADVVDAMAVANYQEQGPTVILTMKGQPPADLGVRVKAMVQAQPEPPRATFLTVKSPSGALWRIGVDDAGQLHVEGEKPSVSKSAKP